MRNRTFHQDNQFHFECPVFRTEVRLADCNVVEQDHKRANPQPNRGGCSVAIHCGKCPVEHLTRFLSRNLDLEIYSAEKRTGRLPDITYEKISRVIIQEKVMTRYPLTPEEQTLLVQANDAIGALADKPKARPGASIDSEKWGTPVRARRATATRSEQRSETKPASTRDAGLEAALSGDMSAAINAIASGSSSVPGEMSLLERAKAMRAARESTNVD